MSPFPFLILTPPPSFFFCYSFVYFVDIFKEQASRFVDFFQVSYFMYFCFVISFCLLRVYFSLDFFGFFFSWKVSLFVGDQSSFLPQLFAATNFRSNPALATFHILLSQSLDNERQEKKVTQQINYSVLLLHRSRTLTLSDIICFSNQSD